MGQAQVIAWVDEGAHAGIHQAAAAAFGGKRNVRKLLETVGNSLGRQLSELTVDGETPNVTIEVKVVPQVGQAPV